jgi:hypothetical protein
MVVVSAWLVVGRGAMNGRRDEAPQSVVTIGGADQGVSLKLVHVNANVGAWKRSLSGGRLSSRPTVISAAG